MALNLSVPVSKRSLPKDIHVSPRKARAWVESLPLTRPVEAAQMLVQNLDALNRAKLEPEERVATVEAYRTVMTVIFDELDALYANAPLPLQAKAREAAEVGSTLLTELSFSYKLDLLARSGKFLVFNAKKNITPLALRVLQALRGLLLLSYKTYRAAPVGLWQEAHEIFAFANARELDGIRITDTEKETIRDVYIEMCMLSLADPNRLTPKEMGQAIEILRANRGLIDLHGEGGQGDLQKHFVVALESDNGPKPPQHPASVNATGSWRLLDSSRLIERLTKKRKAAVGAPTNRASAEFDDLTDRLIHLWGDPPKRQFHRHPVDTLARVCAGVRAIAHFAELNQTRTIEFSQHSTRPMQTIPTSKNTTTVFSAEDWQVLNQSTNGLRVRRSTSGKVSVCVGEAVGIRPIGGRHWQAGVVRWLAVVDTDAIEFGVELIAPTTRTVHIEPTANATMSRAVSAVLLGSGGAEGEIDMLLAAIDTYTPAREFAYNDGLRPVKVRATTLVERTARFDLFQMEAT